MIYLFDSTADILGVQNKELRCIMNLGHNYLWFSIKTGWLKCDTCGSRCVAYVR